MNVTCTGMLLVYTQTLHRVHINGIPLFKILLDLQSIDSTLAVCITGKCLTGFIERAE